MTQEGTPLGKGINEMAMRNCAEYAAPTHKDLSTDVYFSAVYVQTGTRQQPITMECSYVILQERDETEIKMFDEKNEASDHL